MLIQISLSLWLLTWNTKKLFQLLIIKVYPLKVGVNRGNFFATLSNRMVLFGKYYLLSGLKEALSWSRATVIFDLMSTVKQNYFLNIRWAMKTVTMSGQIWVSLQCTVFMPYQAASFNSSGTNTWQWHTWVHYKEFPHKHTPHSQCLQHQIQTSLKYLRQIA